MKANSAPTAGFKSVYRHESSSSAAPGRGGGGEGEGEESYMEQKGSSAIGDSMGDERKRVNKQLAIFMILKIMGKNIAPFLSLSLSSLSHFLHTYDCIPNIKSAYVSPSLFPPRIYCAVRRTCNAKRTQTILNTLIAK